LAQALLSLSYGKKILNWYYEKMTSTMKKTSREINCLTLKPLLLLFYRINKVNFYSLFRETCAAGLPGWKASPAAPPAAFLLRGSGAARGHRCRAWPAACRGRTCRPPAGIPGGWEMERSSRQQRYHMRQPIWRTPGRAGRATGLASR